MGGDLTVAFHYVKRAYRPEGNELFTWVDNRMKGNVFVLKERRLRLHVRGSFLLRVLSCCSKLPREAVGAPSLEVFNSGFSGPWAILYST